MTIKRKAGIFFRKIFLWITILLAFVTIPVCLVPFLDPAVFWFVAILGIGFPFLLLFNIIILIIWCIRKSRLLFIPLVAILVNIQQIGVVAGYHITSNSSKLINHPDDGQVTIMAWNVARWDARPKKDSINKSNRLAMFEAVKKQNADILCLQEFFEPDTDKYFDKNIVVLDSMGYKYHYFFPAYRTRGQFNYGMAIFSKLPIIDTGKISFGRTPHSEGLIYSDIPIKDKILRIYSLHMESFRMGRKTYFGEYSGEGVADKTKFYGWALKNAYRLRTNQANVVNEAIANSPHPAIVCGNLGDIPNSYAYFKVKGNLKDAFLNDGFGLGQTFRFFLPTLRVDYIFFNDKIEMIDFAQPNLNYTDHFPLLITLKLH